MTQTWRSGSQEHRWIRWGVSVPNERLCRRRPVAKAHNPLNTAAFFANNREGGPQDPSSRANLTGWQGRQKRLNDLLMCPVRSIDHDVLAALRTVVAGDHVAPTRPPTQFRFIAQSLLNSPAVLVAVGARDLNFDDR